MNVITLDDHDLKYLTVRGISRTAAERYGLRTVTAEEIQSLLGRHDVDSPGLLIPYPQYNGETALSRSRLHVPLRSGNEEIRYLQAKRTPPRPFITQSAWKYRAGPRPLLNVEGEMKALAGEEAGFLCVASPGCQCWREQ